MTSATERAAGEIRQAMIRDGKAQAADLLLIVDLVREMVRALILGCASTPAAGYDYLTRRFSFVERLLGAERRRERRIRRAVARAWQGPADQMAGVQAGVLWAIEWRLTRTMMLHLYREADEPAPRSGTEFAESRRDTRNHSPGVDRSADESAGVPGITSNATFRHP